MCLYLRVIYPAALPILDQQFAMIDDGVDKRVYVPAVSLRFR
jgi:hypothetical protein